MEHIFVTENCFLAARSNEEIFRWHAARSEGMFFFSYFFAQQQTIITTIPLSKIYLPTAHKYRSLVHSLECGTFKNY
jgi:hypothetical protein